MIKMGFGISAGYMRLQSIGIVKGIPAREIKIGDRLMWNFGETTIVKSVEFSKTRKTLSIVEESGGKDYSRKLGAERLVCILDEQGRYTYLI
jgi:hypothetical protein